MQPLMPVNSATLTIAACGDKNRLFMKLPIRGFIAGVAGRSGAEPDDVLQELQRRFACPA